MEKEQVEQLPLLDQSQKLSLPVRHSEDVKHFSRLGLVRCERQLGIGSRRVSQSRYRGHDDVVTAVLRPREAKKCIVQTSWVVNSAVSHQRNLITAFHWKVLVVTVMMARNAKVDTVLLEERSVCQLHLEVHQIHILHKPGKMTVRCLGGFSGIREICLGVS